MLIFKCNYCKRTYEAKQGQFSFTYIDEDKKEHPGSIDSPCYRCEEVGKRAYKEELERIKIDHEK